MGTPWTVIAAPHSYVPAPGHGEAIARAIEETGAVGHRLKSDPGDIEWAPGSSAAASEQLGFELGPHTVVMLAWGEPLMADASPNGGPTCPDGHAVDSALMDAVQEWVDTGTEPQVVCMECGKAVLASKTDVYPLFGDDPQTNVHTAAVVYRLAILGEDATIENFDTPLHRRIKEILGVDHLQFAYLT